MEEARQSLAWLREGEPYLEEEHEILEVGQHIKSVPELPFSLKVCTGQADSGVGMLKGLRSPSPSFHNQSRHKCDSFEGRLRAGLLLTKRFLHPMMIAGPLMLL